MEVWIGGRSEQHGGEGRRGRKPPAAGPAGMSAAFKGMNSSVRTPFLFPEAEGNQCKAVQPHKILKEMHNLNGKERFL